MRPHQLHSKLSSYEADMILGQLVSILRNSYCYDEMTLKYVCRFLSPQAYQYLVNERILNQRCGYPLCDKSTAVHLHRDPFCMINVRASYVTKYCSEMHMKASSFLYAQLSSTPLSEREGIHLIANFNREKYEQDSEKYDPIIFEEYLREKRTQNDVDALIASIETLDF